MAASSESPWTEQLHIDLWRTLEENRCIPRERCTIPANRLLGDGGYGAVFAVDWKGKPAAAKVFYTQGNRDEAYYDLCTAAHECARHTRLSKSFEAHQPGIVIAHASLGICGLRKVATDLPKRVKDRLQRIEYPTFALVMEMGRNMHHFNPRIAGMNNRSMANCAFQCIYAISRLHVVRRLHGDIKSPNFLLCEGTQSPIQLKLCIPRVQQWELPLLDNKYVVKVTDFGSMQKCLPEREWAPLSDIHPTTITSRAPESLFQEPQQYTFKEETWALGCTLLEILSGNLLLHYKFLNFKTAEVTEVIDEMENGLGKEHDRQSVEALVGQLIVLGFDRFFAAELVASSSFTYKKTRFPSPLSIDLPEDRPAFH